MTVATSSLWDIQEDVKRQYVVATSINPEGETDYLFIEPYNAIDDGCVALTEPMTLDEAKATLEAMKRERGKGL